VLWVKKQDNKSQEARKEQLPENRLIDDNNELALNVIYLRYGNLSATPSVFLS